MVRSWLFLLEILHRQTGLGSADYFEKLYLKVTNGRLIERRDHLFIGKQEFFAIPKCLSGNMDYLELKTIQGPKDSKKEDWSCS